MSALCNSSFQHSSDYSVLILLTFQLTENVNLQNKHSSIHLYTCWVLGVLVLEAPLQSPGPYTPPSHSPFVTPRTWSLHSLSRNQTCTHAEIKSALQKARLWLNYQHANAMNYTESADLHSGLQSLGLIPVIRRFLELYPSSFALSWNVFCFSSVLQASFP